MSLDNEIIKKMLEIIKDDHNKMLDIIKEYCLNNKEIPSKTTDNDDENVYKPVYVPEPSIPDPSIPEPSIPEPSIPEPSIPEPSIPEPSIPEPSIHEPSIPEPSIPEPSIHEPSIHEPSIPEPSIPEPSIPEPSIPEPSIHIDKKSTHSNRWITHVKEFAKIHNISYKEALSKARLTYK